MVVVHQEGGIDHAQHSAEKTTTGTSHAKKLKDSLLVRGKPASIKQASGPGIPQPFIGWYPALIDSDEIELISELKEVA